MSGKTNVALYLFLAVGVAYLVNAQGAAASESLNAAVLQKQKRVVLNFDDASWKKRKKRKLEGERMGKYGHILDGHIYSYRIFGGEELLDRFTKYADFCLSKLTKGSDGWLGWYGTKDPPQPAPLTANVKGLDYVFGETHIMHPMLLFVETVRSNPRLKARYGAAAERYLKVIEDQLVLKWIKRGSFRKTSHGGLSLADQGTKGQDGIKAPRTLAHNKSHWFTIVLCDLWRITGKKVYREKAEALETWFKSRLRKKGQADRE